MDHISLSRWADVVAVAPATATTLSKLSVGSSEDWHSKFCIKQTNIFSTCDGENVDINRQKTTQKF